MLQVDLMDAVFTELKHNPPITKNQPPVAGAINWERSMFHRIKRPMLRFLQVSILTLFRHYVTLLPHNSERNALYAVVALFVKCLRVFFVFRVHVLLCFHLSEPVQLTA